MTTKIEVNGLGCIVIDSTQTIVRIYTTSRIVVIDFVNDTSQEYVLRQSSPAMPESAPGLADKEVVNSLAVS